MKYDQFLTKKSFKKAFKLGTETVDDIIIPKPPEVGVKVYGGVDIIDGRFFGGTITPTFSLCSFNLPFLTLKTLLTTLSLSW